MAKGDPRNRKQAKPGEASGKPRPAEKPPEAAGELTDEELGYVAGGAAKTTVLRTAAAI